MEEIEKLKQKLASEELMNSDDLACFKNHLSYFITQDNFLEYVMFFAPLDLEWTKALILDKTIKDEEFAVMLCFSTQDNAFFEKLVEEGIINNPVLIAEYQEEVQGIGKKALACIKNYGETGQNREEMVALIQRLCYCTDITFKDRLDAVYYYTKSQETIDIRIVSSLLKGVFSEDDRDFIENPAPKLTLTDEDIDSYENLIAYLIHSFHVDTYFTYQALKQLKHFPYFQEMDSINVRMINEFCDFFNRYVDLSQKDNQLLFAAVIGTYWNQNHVDLSEKLDFMEQFVSEPRYLDPEVCRNLLSACFDYTSDLSLEEQVEQSHHRVKNIIMTYLENTPEMNSHAIVELVKTMDKGVGNKSVDNSEKNMSPYVDLVKSILAMENVPFRLTIHDTIELVDSTRNVDVVRRYVEILEAYEEKNPDSYSFMKEFNGNLALSIIHTGDDAFILEQYQKGKIDFKDYMSIIMKAQGITDDDIVQKLEDSREVLDEVDIKNLVCMLQDKEIAKKYIEKLDLSPRLMRTMISSLQDESYIEEYLKTHENIDIHLKYMLASSLINKEMITEMNANMLTVNSLAEIVPEDLTKYQYVMIRDTDRDTDGITGISEIYTSEKMSAILEKAEELLQGIPYSNGGDLIDDSIILKKVYERYAFHSEYDEEAISDAKKNDWRRHLKCRNFEGGILDGLVVCSGDAFCLKNLLSLRGVKAYTTRGEDKYRTDPGHAWNTIRLGDMFFKFDGTAARSRTKREGYLSMNQIKKAHGENDEYQDDYIISQSFDAMNDERNQNVGKKKVRIDRD